MFASLGGAPLQISVAKEQGQAGRGGGRVGRGRGRGRGRGHGLGGGRGGANDHYGAYAQQQVRTSATARRLTLHETCALPGR